MARAKVASCLNWQVHVIKAPAACMQADIPDEDAVTTMAMDFITQVIASRFLKSALVFLHARGWGAAMLFAVHGPDVRMLRTRVGVP
jgi:hypothetical protein